MPSPLSPLAAATACFALLLANASAAPVDFYVSPTGSDDQPGARDAPFATLAHARDRVREHLRTPGAGDVTVHLRGGGYALRETLVLGPEDSAPAGATVTWRGAEGEEAVISSGVRVTGWRRFDGALKGLPKQAAGKLWVADLPAGLDKIYTLYQGDTRLPRAQTPGFTPDTDIHPRDKPTSQLDRYTLHYPEGAVRDWANLEDAELIIIPSYPWWMNILSLASVDEDRRIARTTLPATVQMCPMVKYARDAFPLTAWIENVPEGMTEPGRWMLNSQQRRLYYWPKPDDAGRPGEPGDDLFAPALRELIRVEGVNDTKGDQDRPVRGLRFVNLRFTRADRGVWRADDAGIQHDWEMVDRDNAMLRFRGAEDCRVERCRFTNAGGNAIRMDLYAQRIAVERCLFDRLGQSAVMMIGYGPGVKDVNKQNRVVNNHVHHCGEIYWHSQMITAFQSGENVIAHNHLHDIPRKAICITGVRAHWLKHGRRRHRECVDTVRWDEIGGATTLDELLPYLHSRNNLIENNDIHDALQRLGDGAAVNVSGAGPGNTIRLNYLHDIPARHCSAAIRCDNDQVGTLIEKNVIVNVAVAGASPKEVNTLRNNFIVQVCTRSNGGYIRGLGRGGLSRVERNIILNPFPKRELFGYHILDKLPPEAFAEAPIDHNLYFCPGTTEADWPELAEMRQRGGDKHSLFADPLFVDWRNRDFRLRPDSPAHRLGIEPIDISAAGLTDDFPDEWR